MRQTRKVRHKLKDVLVIVLFATLANAEDGFWLGQKAVEEKSNEITEIPKLLDQIQIKGQIITINARGTQKAIAEKVWDEKGKRKEYQYYLNYLSSLRLDIETFKKVVRGH